MQPTAGHEAGGAGRSGDAALPAVVPSPGVPLEVPPLTRLDVHVFRAPIDTPVRTSFGTMTDRPAVLVRIEDEDGCHGWGEIWCNFPTCGAEHRGRLAASVLAPRLLGRAFPSPVDAFAALERETRVLALQTREYGPIAQAIAGVDVALWDLVARRAGQPLWQCLGAGGAQPRVPVYASGINPDGAVESVARAREAGYSAFKIKIGFDPDADRAVIERLAAAMGPGEGFMVDANQAWTPAQARRLLPALAEAGAGWLEEPMPADTPVDAWRALAGDSPVPLAGGENLATEAQFIDAADGGWLQVIQPDLCKWGGVSRCVPVARYVLGAGRRYCPHYLGGGIGLIASGHALAAVGGDGLLEVDVNANPLRETLAQPFPRVADGGMALSTVPGLGVEPDLDAAGSWCTLRLSQAVTDRSW
ncbi:mandelate racemase/muconate lactonizing enzyme family protein [Aquisalimonas lutea]|uniref:mandelate racemase/muconate lactonizing enzyme family protein n=1 Tax=Aquisalimonas lutea TaxID=1327750 RepID=UPI0025B61299|nr:mandelate racemase/muconate lactonizing enzyme family protein [Aquisalimonas lutea]MDN3516473.1 mandelate racemase/muconate lactonizing enzyme family protein [Aquisalimonas lutea]